VSLQFIAIVLLGRNANVIPAQASVVGVVQVVQDYVPETETVHVTECTTIQVAPIEQKASPSEKRLPRGWKEFYPLKHLVDAFVSGRIDWHFLVPGQQRQTLNDGVKFEQLVKKERELVQTLLGARDKTVIGPIDNPSYNPDYRFCSALNDKCVIHRNSNECEADGFCSWCNSTRMCVERYTALKPDGLGKGTFLSLCPDFIQGKKLNVPKASGVVSDYVRFNKAKNQFESRHAYGRVPQNYGFTQLNSPLTSDMCKNIVRGITIIGGMQWEGMYYHAIKSHLVNQISRSKEAGTDRLHFIVVGEPDPVNFKWFGMLTKSCVRTMHEVPDGTCFEQVQFTDLFYPNDNFWAWSNFVLEKLNLMSYPDVLANHKPVACLITRHNKRIILNEPEVVVATSQVGFETRVLDYDRMTVEEQLLSTRECDVLIGIHGSGMLNEIFMRKDTYAVQIVPYGLPGKGIELGYGDFARNSELKYRQFDVKGKENSVIHWHFAEDIFGDSYIDDTDAPQQFMHGSHKFSKSQVLEHGSRALSDTSAARVLMVQQDAIVPIKDFLPFIRDIFNEITM
jgi:hypothetical protein